MSATMQLQRVRLRVRGAVQGVGFRPFVYRLAHDLGVGGWVGNDAAGVVIEAEAEEDVVARFVTAVRAEAPPHARIHEILVETAEPQRSARFRIVESTTGASVSAAVLPDIATCDECRREIADAGDRRAGYAFTNCTNCGPRFSIVRALPYDRRHTTMAGFRMCAACAAEYVDPANRRFHAQPNACPECGPRLSLVDAHGDRVATGDPLALVAAALRNAAVVAVKGLGGFHLMCDARSQRAVDALRVRKRRPTKPFALMARDVAQARRFTLVEDGAAALLESAEGPIVLLPRRPDSLLLAGADTPIRIAAAVAPCQSRLGVMLPAMPLHHLLLAYVDYPLVATSGNLSEEPICTDEREVVARLGGIADMFLIHDRPIERHVDDSVVALMDGAMLPLRRARGYAPLPVLVRDELPPILAVGPHQKNTIAVSHGRQVFISQHIGDLETHEAQRAFTNVIEDFMKLYAVEPVALAHDLHPDYMSTAWAADAARRFGVPAVPVQHHHAHLVSCLADNGAQGPALGVVWDGTGYGTDGTIWGGEFLLGDASGFTRCAHLRPFRLPGSDAAVKEPRRVAAALLHDLFGPGAVEAGDFTALRSFAPADRRTLEQMLARGLNSPVTTSAGRLLDGIAALLGLCTLASYEGEAAIRLEQVADPAEHGAYHLAHVAAAGAGPAVLDWRPLVLHLIGDVQRGAPIGTIAARVHNAFVETIVREAELVGCERVALTGGCFQNRLFAERGATALRRHGFHVLTHRQVPPNDGGISLGQLMVAAAQVRAITPLSAES